MHVYVCICRYLDIYVNYVGMCTYEYVLYICIYEYVTYVKFIPETSFCSSRLHVRVLKLGCAGSTAVAATLQPGGSSQHMVYCIS